MGYLISKTFSKSEMGYGVENFPKSKLGYLIFETFRKVKWVIPG